MKTKKRDYFKMIEDKLNDSESNLGALIVNEESESLVYAEIFKEYWNEEFQSN